MRPFVRFIMLLIGLNNGLLRLFNRTRTIESIRSIFCYVNTEFCIFCKSVDLYKKLIMHAKFYMNGIVLQLYVNISRLFKQVHNNSNSKYFISTIIL